MKKHKFHKTTIEHHKDGSHTIHHHHEDGDKHDVRHAVAREHGLDGVHDSLEDHLGSPNPGEGADESGAPMAAMGAAPAAAMPPAGA